MKIELRLFYSGGEDRLLLDFKEMEEYYTMKKG
jgi:hypothetical protein